MAESYTTVLDSFLADAAEPTWSSFAIEQLFSQMGGDTKTNLQELLPHIDRCFAAAEHRLTQTQTNFLRDITVWNYHSRTYSPFTAGDIDWLLTRFQSDPLPHRALMIALLVSIDELPNDTSMQVVSLLIGTPGERWVSAQ